MHGLIRPGFLMTLCLLVATVSSGADRHFEKKFSVGPGGMLRLSTDVGSVTVTGSSSNEVSIVAELRGSEHDVNDFEITADQSGTGIDVKGRSKGGHGFWNFGSNNLDIRYTISVPKEYSLEMNTSGGNISVSTLKGSVKGGTSGGNIDVMKVEGPVDMHTSGGNMRAEGITGKVDMETSGGEVKVATVSGDVDVSTSGGDIRLSDVDGRVRAETSGGDVEVRLKNTNKGVYVETSGGNIELAMAKNSSASIDASTSGGDVTCDLPIMMSGKISESRIRGEINGGGAAVHARTSGGDIRIVALQ
jgi:DUF4097 and DUF4098 domain-containing protein YvlB